MTAIYLDHAATTPVRAEVREAMAPFDADNFGNSSSTHAWGRRAANALEEARTRVGTALGVDRNDVFFVRGGTESDNMAVFGRTSLARSRGRTPVVAVSAVEHKAVLSAAKLATEPDGRCFVLPVAPDGSIDTAALDEAFAARPDLLSVMWVNNEVGVRLPVETLAARADEAGVCFHTDAVQALGKVPVALGDVPVHLATLTGHKIYGPKSTGLLYKRRGTELDPRVVGGGQERGLRSGTHDVGGAVGLAVAIELVVAEQEEEARRLGGLRQLLLSSLLETTPDLIVHGAPESAAPHVLSVGFPGVDPQALLIELDIAGVAVSGGSACQSGTGKGSHVIEALYGDTVSGAAVRFSFGKLNDEDNTREAAARVASAVEKLRRLVGAT